MTARVVAVACVLAVAPGCTATDGSESPGGGDAHATVVAHPRLTIAIPPSADRAIELADPRSGMRASFRLEGASGSVHGASDGTFRYPDALGDGLDLVVVTNADGLEDWVVLPTRLADPRVRYVIDVSDAAGLRLVGRTLELLDAGGAPRLRVAPPWVLDADGRKAPVSVAVMDCAVDVDPRAPWERPVVHPGAATCTVELRWDDAALRHPMMLDPLWVDGGTLAGPRVARAVTLGDGRVMLAGGRTQFETLDGVEIFDPSTSTWAASTPLPWPRHGAGAVALSTGGGEIVIVAGGCAVADSVNTCMPTDTTAVFDVATGSWTEVGALAGPRANHEAFALPDGTAMVVGGVSSDDIATGVLATTEVFDPIAGTWSAGPALHAPRDRFGHAVLPDGRIFVVGGISGLDVEPIDLADGEIFDPAAGAWQQIPAGPYVRRSPTATALDDERVLVLGGIGNGSALQTSEIYDSAQGTWTTTGKSSQVRFRHTAHALPNGWLLAAGGCCGADQLVELYRPQPNAQDAVWTETESLSEGRTLPASAVLRDGRLLLAGGWAGSTTAALATTVVWEPRAAGDACGSGGECTSGFCVDGVCCSEACEGACHACSRASGASTDGACSPVGAGLSDPRRQCADTGAGSCGADGTCGDGGLCAVRPAGTECGCAEETTGACDGEGLCVCEPASCVDDRTLETIDGDTIDCTPHRCEGSRCLSPCTTSTDCLHGFACDRHRRCVALSAPIGESGCACRAGASSPTSPFASIVLAALARLWRFRRRGSLTSWEKAGIAPRRAARSARGWTKSSRPGADSPARASRCCILEGMRASFAAALVSATIAACGGDDAPPPAASPAPCPPPSRVVGEHCLEPGVADEGCPAGTMGQPDGSCRAAGIAPGECAQGFVHDGDVGCTEVLPPRPCPDGNMAVPGETECRPVAPCAEGTWGDIPVEQSTQYVDASYPGLDSDGSAQRPWITIADAYAAADAGAIIAVAAGSYAEDLLFAGKSVRLWGVCPALVEIVGSTAGSAALFIGAGATEVRDLSVTGAKVGVLVTGAEGVVLDRVWIHDTDSRGLNIENAQGLTSVDVSRSLIERAREAGGFVLSSHVTLTEVVVRDTQPQALSQAFGHGLELASCTAGAPCPGDAPGVAQLQRCVFERNHELGIAVSGAEATIDATVVRDTLPRPSDDAGGRGISVQPLCGFSGCDGDMPGKLVVTGSVVAGNHDAGIFVGGSSATIERTVVRATLPSAMDVGAGVFVQSCASFAGCEPVVGASATLKACVLQDNHSAGVAVSGSHLTMEGSVVRRTWPRPSDQRAGRGVDVSLACTPDGCDAEPRPDVAVVGSVLEDNHEVGIFASAAVLSVDRTVVRRTHPHPLTLAHGFGVVVQPSCFQGICTPATQSTATITSSLVEQSTSAGVFIAFATASLATTAIRDSVAAGEGSFGDGVLVYGGPEPTHVTIADCSVRTSARAGLANFGSTVTLGKTALECAAFELEGEPVGPVPFTFQDTGGNRCGCPVVEDGCVAVSAGLAPPQPF